MKFAAPWVATLAVCCAQAVASDALDELSLEELVKTEVTSVSRKAQNLADVPAAAFVISSEDIRRSGAQALPEVLRMVPGIQVAQIDSGRYAVSARGFNGRFANKLQVLVDGRSIYNPLFSGVLWEQDLIPLEDIERIEVIRGPGAAMWGVNAVNGVINIISRSARSQQGNSASISMGSRAQALLYVRHGAEIDENSHFKISYQGRHTEPSGQKNADGKNHDRLNSNLLDTRFDRNLGNGEDLTLWANFSRSDLGDQYYYPNLRYENQNRNPLLLYAVEEYLIGENLMGRYRWLGDSGTESHLQAAVTRSGVNVGQFFEERRDTFDLDYQGRLASSSHDLLWGASYRTTRDQVTTHPDYAALDPSQSSQQIAGIFLQDDWIVFPDKLKIGLGIRFDHSSRTGSNLSPNITAIWTPSLNDSLWAKYAKAPRIPARVEQDINIYTGIYKLGALPLLLRSKPGGKLLAEEKLEGLEIGYRRQFSQNFNMDFSAYRYRYSDLRSARYNNSLPYLSNFPPLLAIDFEICNCLSGYVTGLEIATEWLLTPAWRLQLSLSEMRVAMNQSVDRMAQQDGQNAEVAEPRHYATLRSLWNISRQHQLDFWLRAVAGFERVNVPYTDTIHVAGYVTLDAHYIQRINDGQEFFISGKNLLGRKRTEAIPDYLPAMASDVNRTLMLGTRFKF